MPKLNLNVQYASSAKQLPTRSQFRKWVKASLRIDTEVTIRIVDEQEGRELNSTYRGKDYPTNVLTFPLTETPHLMGDIIICAPVVEAEAKRRTKHLKHIMHI